MSLRNIREMSTLIHKFGRKHHLRRGWSNGNKLSSSWRKLGKTGDRTLETFVGEIEGRKGQWKNQFSVAPFVSCILHLFALTSITRLCSHGGGDCKDGLAFSLRQFHILK